MYWPCVLNGMSVWILPECMNVWLFPQWVYVRVLSSWVHALGVCLCLCVCAYVCVCTCVCVPAQSVTCVCNVAVIYSTPHPLHNVPAETSPDDYHRPDKISRETFSWFCTNPQVLNSPPHPTQCWVCPTVLSSRNTSFFTNMDGFCKLINGLVSNGTLFPI
jgi:hypothetical protein